MLPGAAPANFGGFSGNQGVVGGIQANAGSIGYVEAANANAATGTKLQFATVNGKDPVNDLPQERRRAGLQLNECRDRQRCRDQRRCRAYRRPGRREKAGCVQLVKPAAYANITTVYPIVAVTYFLFSSAGNGATNAGRLQILVNELNPPGNFGSHITSVNAPTTASGTGTTGFAALGGSFNSGLEGAAKNCIGV